MYPRFVERCCNKEGHMSEDDPWVIDNNRRETEKEIRMKLGGSCEVVQWFESTGVEKEPEIEQIRRMGLVGRDGVHLSGEHCKCAAVYLCSRVHRQNVPRQNVRRDKTSQDKTSSDMHNKTSRDKTS